MVTTLSVVFSVMHDAVDTIFNVVKENVNIYQAKSFMLKNV